VKRRWRLGFDKRSIREGLWALGIKGCRLTGDALRRNRRWSLDVSRSRLRWFSNEQGRLTRWTTDANGGCCPVQRQTS
jgi:hypothetical protein